MTSKEACEKSEEGKTKILRAARPELPRSLRPGHPDAL